MPYTEIWVVEISVSPDTREVVCVVTQAAARQKLNELRTKGVLAAAWDLCSDSKMTNK